MRFYGKPRNLNVYNQVTDSAIQRLAMDIFKKNTNSQNHKLFPNLPFSIKTKKL